MAVLSEELQISIDRVSRLSDDLQDGEANDDKGGSHVEHEAGNRVSANYCTYTHGARTAGTEPKCQGRPLGTVL